MHKDHERRPNENLSIRFIRSLAPHFRHRLFYLLKFFTGHDVPASLLLRLPDLALSGAPIISSDAADRAILHRYRASDAPRLWDERAGGRDLFECTSRGRADTAGTHLSGASAALLAGHCR